MAKPRPFRTDDPALYRIRVEGIVRSTLADHYGGLQILVEDASAVVTTELLGPVRDQVELIGLLTFLVNDCLPIVLVERISALNHPGHEHNGC